MSNAARLAREQLLEIADASNGCVEIHRQNPLSDGWHQFDISIRFDGLDRDEKGLQIRAREFFTVLVPETFPFDYPKVATPHARFAGFPHVQWRRQPCLYGSSSQWNPEVGMYGFVKRLDAWVRDAALNNLDPNDLPLHPPVAYSKVNRLFVPRADTPLVIEAPWFGWAELKEINNRTEIVGWSQGSNPPSADSAVAVLLHKKLPFEYPRTVRGLLDEFESHDIEYAPFILQLSECARQTDEGRPLAVVLGAPMRGVQSEGSAIQHLAVWEISAADADKLRKLDQMKYSGDAAQRSAATKDVAEWSHSANVGWCAVREMRQEVTQRRDHSSAANWFHGRRVTIWGCGAIGTHVAESVARAGAAAIELVDDGVVAPGLLVRQLFEDSDIGKLKANALSERLSRISPQLETIVSTENLIPLISTSEALAESDLIIDCTASLAVRTALERSLRDVDARPPIAFIAVDERASMAVATLSTRNHSGATLDLLRRLKLEACRRPALSKILAAFWPRNNRGWEFQPEPGCSEPTFVGSHADLASLSCGMLNSIARGIQELGNGYSASGLVCDDLRKVHEFRWRADQVVKEPGRGYSVRVSSLAMREMQAWASRSSRTAGEDAETGGLVFGELSEGAGVLWVTEVEGPPPDSEADEHHFTCGTQGMKECAQKKEKRFLGSVDCIGSWHTHPKSSPELSDVDIGAVVDLLAGEGSTRKTCLILILSGKFDQAVLGAHAFRTKLGCERFVRLERHSSAMSTVGSQTTTSGKIGLALSGGGSRAIAFHLGCLRALYDLGILDNIRVVSSVSGGAVIAAMYAYSDDPFEKFDRRVVALLQEGLQRKIFRETIRVALVKRVTEASSRSRSNATRMRRFSRTEAFRDVLGKHLYGETKMADVARGSLDTVINSTELRTGSAFRFGSRESGCWRFGKILPSEALVADAVAASAAYPVYLPALERKYSFTRRGGGSSAENRVVLTDGGVFDNLGVSALEPKRTSSTSTNVFDVDYVLCCDAGSGLFDDDSYPSRWRSRMKRSFETVFRKAQDATRNKLHQLADSEDISGFVLCYLGQQDRALPWIPTNLPSRDEVRHCPTDFAAMSDEMIELLTLRGELLMRLLVSHHISEVFD